MSSLRLRPRSSQRVQLAGSLARCAASSHLSSVLRRMIPSGAASSLGLPFPTREAGRLQTGA